MAQIFGAASQRHDNAIRHGRGWAVRGILGLIYLAALWIPSVSQAVQITIGNIVIVDNGPLDRNPAADIIEFRAGRRMPPVPPSFALPAGSTVTSIRGKVELGAGAGGAFGGIFGVPMRVVTLTNLRAHRGPVAGNNALDITFEHTFNAPNAPIFATSDIAGSINNQVPNRIPRGSSVTWQGIVNNTRIQPPPGPFQFIIPNAGPVQLPAVFFSGGGPRLVLAGGPPWVAKGNLSIGLSVTGSIVVLPISANVGIGSCLPIEEYLTLDSRESGGTDITCIIPAKE